MEKNIEIPTALPRIYQLIKGCDEMIASFKLMGEKDDSLMIRQELHLRKQYIQELNEILGKIHLKVVETYNKAA